MDLRIIQERAASDLEFREALVADPQAVLTELGVAIPQGITIKVVEPPDGECVIALPAYMAQDEIVSEADLAEVSAGLATEGVQIPSKPQASPQPYSNDIGYWVRRAEMRKSAARY